VKRVIGQLRANEDLCAVTHEINGLGGELSIEYVTVSRQGDLSDREFVELLPSTVVIRSVVDGQGDDILSRCVICGQSVGDDIENDAVSGALSIAARVRSMEGGEQEKCRVLTECEGHRRIHPGPELDFRPRLNRIQVGRSQEGGLG